MDADADVVPDADALADTDAFAPSDVASVECRGNDDCKALAGACRDAVCEAGGTCRAIPLAGEACDDGDPCTKADRCEAGTCEGTTYACDDHLICTSDVCDGAGGCLTRQVADTCLVAGACYAKGDRDPANGC